MEDFPRVVHQIWYNFREWGKVSKEGLPAKYETIRRQWQSQNPGWKFILWNEHSTEAFLNKTFSPAVADKFRSYKLPIQRADFFRWVALYYFGGCYLDTDCTPLQPLDTLLNRHLLKKDNNPHVLVLPDSSWAANAMILATPRHPAVAKLITQMPTELPIGARWIGTESVARVFFTTGPAAVRSKLASQTGVIFDPDMMWHVPGQPGPVPPDRPFVAQHKGDGTWNFQTLLAKDIARLVFAILFIVVTLTLVAFFFITHFAGKPRWRTE